MIKSMTGFASLTRDDERGAIGVTIRSVNHRFLDLQLRLPPSIADLEAAASRDRPEAPGARPRRDQRVAAIAPERGADSRAERGIRAGLSGAIEQARSRGLVAGSSTPATCCECRKR
jgi:hypothetical protein